MAPVCLKVLGREKSQRVSFSCNPKHWVTVSVRKKFQEILAACFGLDDYEDTKLLEIEPVGLTGIGTVVFVVLDELTENQGLTVQVFSQLRSFDFQEVIECAVRIRERDEGIRIDALFKV